MTGLCKDGRGPFFSFGLVIILEISVLTVGQVFSVATSQKVLFEEGRTLARYWLPFRFHHVKVSVPLIVELFDRFQGNQLDSTDVPYWMFCLRQRYSLYCRLRTTCEQVPETLAPHWQSFGFNGTRPNTFSERNILLTECLRTRRSGNWSLCGFLSILLVSFHASQIFMPIPRCSVSPVGQWPWVNVCSTCFMLYSIRRNTRVQSCLTRRLVVWSSNKPATHTLICSP